MAALLIFALAGQSLSQARRTVVRGIVVSTSAPVAGANVFIVETLDGALSDSTGHFSFATEHTGSALLVVKSAGFAEVRRSIQIPGDPLTVVLHTGAHALAPTTVVASRYSASDERGATLTTLDVVSTPGTNADVMRALQTLPGIQSVDEGTGLYVRGGDYSETHVLLNDAVLHTSYNFESPNGTFIGTVDPFLLDGISFSSGGFGARYGNALSGVAALNTMGRPRQSALTAGAGLAALSLAGALPINKQLSVRAASNEFDTDLLFRVNGSTQHYDTPPRGHDRSGSLIWNYRRSGELKIFGIRQTNDLSTEVPDPSFTGAYTLDIGSHLAVLNWRDVYGQWSPSVRASDTHMSRSQDYGAFRMRTGERYSGGSAQVDFAGPNGVTLRAGTDWERNWQDLNGSIPDNSYAKAPGSRITTVTSATNGDRLAGFTEADFFVGARSRVIAGLRQDHSSLTHSATLDPRVSTATTLIKDVVLTTAWGVYHQLPDPTFYDPTLGDPTLPSMRATHAIVGLQAGSQEQMLRVELWDKRYKDLAQATRDYDVSRSGTGRARGMDVFVSGGGIPGMKWRVSYSSVHAMRTDPNTREVATAPFDITTSLTTVVNYSIGAAWHLGLTQHYATGRPFTPVTGATYDAVQRVWIPTYAAPMSDRMPPYQRLDLGLTHLRRIASVNAVFYSAVNNVFDRDNIYGYRYAGDYSNRFPIRSLFKRSVYVGASITTQ
jgi:hypothetical protein